MSPPASAGQAEALRGVVADRRNILVCGATSTGKTTRTNKDFEMNNVVIFWLQLVASFAVFALGAAWYVWPLLVKLSLRSALVPLLWVHVFRYVGMTLLVTGMVDPNLPNAFLASAAYGDLLEAALALASIFALRSHGRGAVLLVWVTNIWGFADLLNGVRGVVEWNVPSFNLATFWYIYTFYAPMVIVSHVMIFGILFKSRSWRE